MAPHDPGSAPLSPSEQEAARLKTAFEGVELPEIQGTDFSKITPPEIAKLLPPYGGRHPMKAILIDKKTGKAYGIASGWDGDAVTENGMTFASGAIRPEVAAEAGGPWATHGNHLEPVAAAFLRKMGIVDAAMYITGRNPCWGAPDGTGCYYNLPAYLADGTTLIVYNKHGSDFISSHPERRFRFVGVPD